MTDNGYIALGDCLELMEALPSASVDMILCDLPYGVTKNKWDSQIPLDKLWAQYKRIAKTNAAIVLFADGMFEAKLMLSNPDMWRYNLVWDKVLTTGFLNSKRMPLRVHEEICVFYNKQPTYNPQMTLGKQNHSKGKPKEYANYNYYKHGFVDNADPKPHPSVSVHPTQKSLELCEWLIKTYTNPGDTVLDNCMGSGTTCLAARNTGRRYIGFERDENYFKVAQERLSSPVAA